VQHGGIVRRLTVGNQHVSQRHVLLELVKKHLLLLNSLPPANSDSDTGGKKVTGGRDYFNPILRPPSNI
jgi:hypothetical protein